MTEEKKTTTYFEGNFEIISEVISLEGVDLFVIAPGIFVSRYKGDVVLDMDLVFVMREKYAILTKNEVLPHLFIVSEKLIVSKEARESGATPEANEFVKGTAIICNLLHHRILGNFFIRVQKPPTPTKMFTSVEAGIKWLNEL